MAKNKANVVKKNKVIDYKKYASLFIEKESTILTNNKREIQSKLQTIKTYKTILDSIIIPYLIKYKLNIPQLDSYSVEKILTHIQSTGYRVGNTKQNRIYSKSTMRLVKIVFYKYIDFLIKEKIVNTNENPFSARINGLKDSNSKTEKAIRDKYLDDNELNLVVGHIEDNIEVKKKSTKGRFKERYKELHDACMLMLCFGLRLSEVCNLAKSDFTITNNLVKLHVKPSKRAKERDTYCIFKHYKDTIINIIENSTLEFNYNTIQTQLQRIAGKLNINKLSAHSFRHSFGTYAVNIGLSYDIIASMLGHNDISTTKIYAKLLGVGVEKNLVSVLGL